VRRNKLRQRRVNKNITVPQIAILLGISQSYYYKIEAGIRNPTLILAAEIASILNSSIDELFFDLVLDGTYRKRLKQN